MMRARFLRCRGCLVAVLLLAACLLPAAPATAHHDENCGMPLAPPQAMAPRAAVWEAEPLRWSWLHWWEANRMRFLASARQGGDLQAVDEAFLERLRSEAREAIIAALEDPDPRVRHASITALSRVGGEGVADLLERIVTQTRDADARRLALVGIGELADSDAAAFLAAHPYPDQAAREAGIAALGLLPEISADIQGQLQRTLDRRPPEPPGLLTHAAWTLTQHADTTQLEPIDRVIRTSDSPWVVAEAILALGELKDPRSLPLLKQILLTHPRSLRTSALRDLPVWRRLYDEQVEVERRIQEINRAHRASEQRYDDYVDDYNRRNEGNPNAPPPAERPEDRPPVQVVRGVQRIYLERIRASAAIALGRFEQDEADAALIDLLAERDDAYNLLPKGFAVMALGEKASEAGMPTLLALALDRSERGHLKGGDSRKSPLRGQAALALGLYARVMDTPQGPADRPRTVEVLNLLAERLTDDREQLEVRLASAVALGLTGRNEVLPALQRQTEQLGRRDELLAGYLLLARGMLGDLGALPIASRFLAARSEEKEQDAVLANRAAVLGVGLLRTEEAMPILQDAWHLGYYTSREVILAIRLARGFGMAERMTKVLRESSDAGERLFFVEALGELLAPDFPARTQAFVAQSNYTWKNDRRAPFQSLANPFLFDFLIPATVENRWF